MSEDSTYGLDAETVIVSSVTDEAHDHVAMVRNEPRVINALDVATGRTEAMINGEAVVAIATAESPNHYDHEIPRDNAVYAFKAGGLWFFHLGDLGYGLSDEELQPFVGKSDVLMAVTGERNTLSLEELDPMIDLLNPGWVLPMHYALPPMGVEGMPGGGMTTVDEFLNRRRGDTILITPASYDKTPPAQVRRRPTNNRGACPVWLRGDGGSPRVPLIVGGDPRGSCDL